MSSSSDQPPALLCVVGPTASGKSDLAVEIALRWDAEVISADASQVYREFDIGTGKITVEEQRGVPHHLLSYLEPDGINNVGAFAQRAEQVIREIQARGRRVIVCGGTGLYVQGLIYGICDAPKVTLEIEQALNARVEAGELEALYRELGEVDPDSLAKIMPNDKQRITRSLGVYLSVGVPLSELQAQHQFRETRYPALVLGLDPPRELLNERIARRVDAMWDAGFLDEVRGLYQAGYTEALQSMKAIGYRFALATLEGEMTEAEARERMLFATRQYARRQRRFFNSQLPTEWVTPPEGEVKVSYAEVEERITAWWSTP